MAELERLIQRLEADNTQFMNALEQTRRGLTGLDQATTRTASQTVESFSRAARAVQASSQQMAAGNRLFQSQLVNTGHQLTDFVVDRSSRRGLGAAAPRYAAAP